jgi:hypothetical protein
MQLRLLLASDRAVVVYALRICLSRLRYVNCIGVRRQKRPDCLTCLSFRHNQIGMDAPPPPPPKLVFSCIMPIILGINLLDAAAAGDLAIDVQRTKTTVHGWLSG